MKIPKLVIISLSISISTIMMVNHAQAYLDPSSGSYVLQIMVATFLGAFISVKTFGKRIYNYFWGKKNNEKEEEQ